MTDNGSEYSEFEGFTVEYRDASHRYWLIQGIERTPAVSVTSALNVLEKGALLNWYGRMDSQAVLTLERDGVLQGVGIDEAHEIMKGRALGASAARDAGAARGTAVHDALEVYCSSGDVPSLDAYDPSVRGHVQALCAWLADASPEPLVVEQIVGSPRYGFAGRFDLIANIEGARTLVDLKTGRNAHNYPESHIQLRGYELAMPECGIEVPERAMVLYAAEDGHYETAHCQAAPQHFLDVLAAHRSVAAVKAGLRAAEKAQVTA